MGKNLIQQKRGKGSPRYRAHSFYYKAEAKLPRVAQTTVIGKIVDIVKCPGHYAPLVDIKLDNGEQCFIIAPEGIRVGEEIQVGQDAQVRPGNILPLKNIPEGTSICNIEAHPGDGGKFVRSTGGFARVLGRLPRSVTLLLPSKKRKEFNPECRAIVGIVAGSGRPEKPLLKAGNNYFRMTARNKVWPKVSGTSQNSVNHPFGGGGKPGKTVSRHASPGRKVGKIAPRRTGRKR